jgi:peptide/nickel transport system permease protein
MSLAEQIPVGPPAAVAGASRAVVARIRAWVTHNRPRGFLEIYGFVMLAVVVAAVFVVPAIAGVNPNLQDLDKQLVPPGTPGHPLGTDNLGRDTLARVLVGGRVSVVMGVFVVVLAGTVGILVGAVAGFFGGLVDEVLMRIVDIFLSFPSIMLALVVVGALGPNIQNAVVGVAIAWWPVYARIIRGQVILIRDRDYVVASRTLGAGSLRILFRTVLPNSLGVLKLIFVLDVGYAILAVATLSFFGLGVQPPEAEWGLLIRESMDYPTYWWMSVFPGLALVLFVSSLNFAGGVLMRSVYERYGR